VDVFSLVVSLQDNSAANADRSRNFLMCAIV